MKPFPTVRSFLLALSEAGMLLFLLAAPTPTAAQQVIEISAILSTTDSTHIDTYSATSMDAVTAYYYDAYVEGYLFENLTRIAAGYAYGYPTAAGGFTRPLTVGRTYEIDSYNSVEIYQRLRFGMSLISKTRGHNLPVTNSRFAAES